MRYPQQHQPTPPVTQRQLPQRSREQGPLQGCQHDGKDVSGLNLYRGQKQLPMFVDSLHGKLGSNNAGMVKPSHGDHAQGD